MIDFIACLRTTLPTGSRTQHPETGQMPTSVGLRAPWTRTCFLLMAAVAGSTGCSSLTSGKLGADDLSLSPKSQLSSGQKAWNQGEVGDEVYATRRSNKIGFKDLAPDKLPKTFKILTGNGPNRQVASDALIEGRKHYAAAVALRKQDPESDELAAAFLKPVDQLSLAAERWPDSTIEEDALYLLGESYFFADHYVDANNTFEKLVQIYPSTQYLDRVQSYRFHIAKYWLDMAETRNSVTHPVNFTDERIPMKDIGGEGRAVLNRIRLDDPTGRLSDDSTFMLGQAFYDAKRFYEAAETFSDLRLNYPGSEYLFNAHLMEFESRLAMYDGKHYDGQALKQAEEILRLIVQRFPQKSAGIRDELSEQAGKVRTMLAERDMETARYFAKRGENQAAKIYLHSIIRDYSETEVATDASKIIAELEGQPDSPDQPAKWLVEMFPEPRSTRALIRSGTFK